MTAEMLALNSVATVALIGPIHFAVCSRLPTSRLGQFPELLSRLACRSGALRSFGPVLVLALGLVGLW